MPVFCFKGIVDEPFDADIGNANAYEQASAEFSMKQLIKSDPIHEAVAKLESKHKKVTIQ